MNNLQKDFLQRSIARLENLSESANREKNLSPEFLRETFRALHTIKGTSQTFGFSAAARLAHELENLLSSAENDTNFKNNLLEGFALLRASFERNDAANHHAFIDKIQRIAPDSAPLQNAFSPEIPEEISQKLSEYEKNAFAAAMRGGKNVFCVKADFDLANFSGEFKDLRENLSASGEIIATLPNPASAANGKIGFLIYFACEDAENIRDGARNFTFEIVRQTSFSDDLNGILSQIVAHGKGLAQKLGKEVGFVTSADKIELSGENMKLIFDALMHLTRNAVDHAFESSEERIAKGKDKRGHLEISLETKDDRLKLSVKDDGRGIDLEKIKRRAAEKNLLPAEKILTGAELLDLIFLPEFSTRESVTEISGRGVGLDAVKNSIETAGGEIRVKSAKDAGTIFEIFLPKKD
ncbi:MAG TPA: ATP-binding protein [Pyrinomonadaceae bacterium]|jgi:chemotaxis protein histidine kinase CheA